MATTAKTWDIGTERSAPLLSALAARLGVALRRAAAGRYAERREHIERTGLAGMI